MRKLFVIILCCFMSLWISNAIASESHEPTYPLIEQIAAVFDEYGEFYSWPSEAYQNLISLLINEGIKDMNLLGDPTTKSISEMQQSLINAFPGVSSNFFTRIIEGIFGEPIYWSLSDQAYYTQIKINHNLLSPHDPLYQLPTSNTYSSADIRNDAITHLIKNHNISKEVLNSFLILNSYYAEQTDPDHPFWSLVFCEPVDSTPIIHIILGNTGEILDCSINNYVQNDALMYAMIPSSGRLYELTLDEQAQFAQLFAIPMYGLPGERDISEAKAKAHADQFLLSNKGITENELNQFIKYTAFTISGAEESSYPFWSVFYVDPVSNKQIYTVEVSAQNGELLSIDYIDWSIPG